MTVVFPDAPLELPNRAGDALAMRTWWNDDDAEQYPNEHCNNAAPAPVQHTPIINTPTMRLRAR